MIKKEIMKKRQDRWDSDNSGRKYYNMQKSINAQRVFRGNRREETDLTTLRFDHTRLNKTLVLLGKSVSDECKVTENVEHMLIHCRKYRAGRIRRLTQKIGNTGRLWDLMSILGTTGGGYRTQKVVVEDLKEIGLYHRI